MVTRHCVVQIGTQGQKTNDFHSVKQATTFADIFMTVHQVVPTEQWRISQKLFCIFFMEILQNQMRFSGLVRLYREIIS